MRDSLYLTILSVREIAFLDQCWKFTKYTDIDIYIKFLEEDLNHD